MNIFTALLAEGPLTLPKLYPVIGPFLNMLVSWLGSMGWAVVIFTFAIKILMSPLDYWSRVSMKKNSMKMDRMKPQLDKMQKQYGHDRNLLQMKTMELYKKEGYSMFGACLPTIVSLIVFIIIFNAFNSYLKYNVIDGYNNMHAAWTQVGIEVEGELASDAAYNALTSDDEKAVYKDKKHAEAWAEEALSLKEMVMPEFLWIDNIWRPDVPWNKSVMNTSQFLANAGLTEGTIDTQEYERIMAPFEEGNRANGFLILPLLAVGFSILSQAITNKTQKAQMELQGQQSSQKTMMVMMPLMMGFFTLMYTSAFALYIVIGSIYSLLSTLLINKIVEKVFGKKLDEMEKNRRTSYRR